MCQCLCCDCWWHNCFGVACAGIHGAYLICSYWLCKPEGLAVKDPECCHWCACDGCGSNCFCMGNICCAPQPVRQWSQDVSAGRTTERTPLANQNYTSWMIHIHQSSITSARRSLGRFYKRFPKENIKISCLDKSDNPWIMIKRAKLLEKDRFSCLLVISAGGGFSIL